jgi:hypothetical protein
MADIPITPDQCECEQDKFLYNIWQTLIGGTLIPGQVTTQFPLGWDVNNITNSILYNIMINIGGGGGGGTVTSVSVISNSLKNNSAPNPIVGAGNVELEVQIIDGTYIDIATWELAGLLLEGVIYRITDFNHALYKGNVNLIRAQFICIKNKSGNLVLSKYGIANSDTYQYSISYDLQADFIMCLFLAELNQRAEQILNDPFNSMIDLPWENPLSTGFNIIRTRISNMTGNYIFEKTYIVDSDINLAGFDAEFHSCFLNTSNVSFSSPFIVSNSEFKQLTTVFVSETIDSCVFEPGSFVTATGSVLNSRVGSGDQIDYLVNTDNKVYESNQNELQTFIPVAAATDEIVNFYATEVYVNLTPAAPIVGYTLRLPAIPLDGQIINIATTEALATVTIDPQGRTIQSNQSTFSKGQCISYYFDSSSDTFYLV